MNPYQTKFAWVSECDDEAMVVGEFAGLEDYSQAVFVAIVEPAEGAWVEVHLQEGLECCDEIIWRSFDVLREGTIGKSRCLTKAFTFEMPKLIRALVKTNGAAKWKMQVNAYRLWTTSIGWETK